MSVWALPPTSSALPEGNCFLFLAPGPHSQNERGGISWPFKTPLGSTICNSSSVLYFVKDRVVNLWPGKHHMEPWRVFNR